MKYTWKNLTFEEDEYGDLSYEESLIGVTISHNANGYIVSISDSGDDAPSIAKAVSCEFQFPSSTLVFADLEDAKTAAESLFNIWSIFKGYLEIASSKGISDPSLYRLIEGYLQA